MIRAVAAEQKPARVVFSPQGWKFIDQGAGRHVCIMPCETTPDLLSLNKAFDAVIRPRSTNAYGDVYRAHMTLCQDCTHEQIEKAKSLVPELEKEIGTGFDVRSVQLMGRVGPAFGGEWKLIEPIHLKDSDDAPDRTEYIQSAIWLLDQYGDRVPERWLMEFRKYIRLAEEEMAFTGLIAWLNKKQERMSDRAIEISRRLLRSNRIQTRDIRNLEEIAERSQN